MILVTGASGLVGLHLIRLLSQRQYQVRAAYRHKVPQVLPGTLTDHIEWIPCDVLDPYSLEQCFAGVTRVYHCAAVVSYDPRFYDEMMEINVEGTANVVNFCLDRPVEKLVFVSSISAIGKEDQPLMISEKTVWNTRDYDMSVYAHSKQKAEMEVWRGIAEGLSAIIVNPGVILGEGDPERSSTALFRIVHNEFPYYTAGATAWVDVQDVIMAMTTLMESELNAERFILSAGNYPYKEIFDKMAVAMHRKAPSRFAPKWLTAIVWRIAYLKSLISGKTATLTRETARNAHEINHYDNRKFLQRFPDFAFRPIEETIQRVCATLYPVQ